MQETRMAASEFLQKNQFTLAIKCHWCGNTGLTIWEKAEAGRQLVSIEGFYERVRKKQPFKIESVCNVCDRVQPI